MDLIVVVPIITVLLLAFYRFFEYKFITHEFKPVKYYIQETVLIFACVLVANVIFSNISHNLTDFMSVITNKPGLSVSSGLPLEVFTELPTF